MPYSITGDRKGILERWNIPLGSYTLAPIAYSGNGVPSPEYTAHFEVVDEVDSLPAIQGFALVVRVDTDEDVRPLSDINLRKDPGFCIRADTLGSVRSLRFYLDGTITGSSRNQGAIRCGRRLLGRLPSMAAGTGDLYFRQFHFRVNQEAEKRYLSTVSVSKFS